MTYKQIETSREARLWLTQIVIPIIGLAMMVPDTREIIMTKAREANEYVKTKLTKK